MYVYAFKWMEKNYDCMMYKKKRIKEVFSYFNSVFKLVDASTAE